jgi:hypothetical protein
LRKSQASSRSTEVSEVWGVIRRLYAGRIKRQEHQPINKEERHSKPNSGKPARPLVGRRCRALVSSYC